MLTACLPTSVLTRCQHWGGGPQVNKFQLGHHMSLAGVGIPCTVEFFTVSPQCKNANIAKFVLAVPFKINLTNEVCNLEM